MALTGGRPQTSRDTTLLRTKSKSSTYMLGCRLDGEDDARVIGVEGLPAGSPSTQRRRLITRPYTTGSSGDCRSNGASVKYPTEMPYINKETMNSKVVDTP